MGIRADIKQHLISRFREVLPDNFAVYLNRPMSIQDTSSYLSILTLTEDSRIFNESPREYERMLSLNLEFGFFPSSNSVDEYITEELTFDNTIELVTAVLKEDEHINNLVSDSYLGSVQFRTESGGERPCFIANVIFTCKYFEAVGVQQILDTLQSAPIAIAEGQS